MDRLRRIPVPALAGGAVYALLLSFGFQAERFGESRPVPALLAALLLFLPFSLLLSRLFRLSLPSLPEASPLRPRRAFGWMLLCWLPSFALHLPGSFAYDVPFQLEQIASGVYSSHHPLLHTLLLGGCVQLGRALGSMTLGAALYTAVQMAALAGLFTLTCLSLERQSGPQAARIAAVFFALYPLHMLMAVNATKDVLFSGCFALTAALVREALCRPQARPESALLCLSCALSVLLRNNMACALAAFVLILALARRRTLSFLLGGSLLGALVLGGGLAACLHASPGDVREALSLPIQQLARVSCLERDRLSDEEKSAIGDLMPDMVWLKYDPTVSDPVKFGFDSAPLRSDPVRYLSCWLSVLAKCPKCCFDAALMLDHAFLYPCPRYGVSGYYLQTGITDAEYAGWPGERIADLSPLPRLRSAVAWRFGAQGAMQIPLAGWLFNTGAICWLLLFFVLRGFARRDGGRLCGLLTLLLLGTFLLGPVMAGRYVYPFVCCLPVLCIATNPKGTSHAT